MILLVSAVREELGELAGEPLGIGAVTACVSMARLLAHQKPDGVVLLGTGGAYAGGPPVGSACVARRVGMGSGAALMGLGYTPRPPAPIPCDLRLVSALSLPVVDVLTVGAVTTDPVLADRLADGWMVEHLEAFGVAAACAAAQVPFVAVLGITNQVGPNAHAQWLTHRNEAREAARAAVSDIVGSV